MKNALGSSLLALGILGACATPGLAAPSLVGSSGLIKTPTAAVLQQGELVLGFSWIGGPRAYLQPSATYGLPPNTNRMYYAGIGLLPGLELSLDMAQAIGWIDPEAPGVAYAIHRLSNVKYQLPVPASWPMVAIGAQDPVSANALSRGAVGQTNYGLTTFYGVISQKFGSATAHLGYGQSQNFIRGPFGGAELELGYGFNLRAEYDSQQVNAGIDWHPASWVRIYGARLFPDDWAYGTAVTWRL